MFTIRNQYVIDRCGGRVIVKFQYKISNMRLLIVTIVCFGAFACQNPEDKATRTNDTTIENQKGRALNTPGGVNSPDTTTTPRMDSTMK
jgi:hypothetical protein